MTVFMTIQKYTIPAGVVGGGLWGTVFGLSIIASLVVGVVCGVLLGGLFTFYVATAIAQGNVSASEAMAAVGGMLGMLALVVILGGMLAWGVRLMFF